MSDDRAFHDPPAADRPTTSRSVASRADRRRVPARRGSLAGNAVESLVVVGLVTLIVALVALQAIGTFGPTVHAMSFLP